MTTSLIMGKGPLTLVTGLMRKGKSHFCVTEITRIREQNPDFNVFANIDGLNIDGVGEAPDDWRDLPNNSIVFYDEAQKYPFFSNSSTKINSDGRVLDITTSGHLNINLVLISQDPQLLHAALRKLVTSHFHVTNPFNNDKPKIFEFTKAQNSFDDSGRWKKNVHATHTHFIDPEIFPLYKSIEPDAEHNKVKRFPLKIKLMFGGAILGFFIVIGLIILAIKGFGDLSDEDDTKSQPVDTVSTSQPQSTQPKPQQIPVKLPTEQDLYSSMLNPTFQIVANNEDLRPAMIIVSGTKCKAFNTYGERLRISKQSCFEMNDDPSLIPRTRQARQDNGLLKPLPSQNSDNKLPDSSTVFGI